MLRIAMAAMKKSEEKKSVIDNLLSFHIYKTGILWYSKKADVFTENIVTGTNAQITETPTVSLAFGDKLKEDTYHGKFRKETGNRSSFW